MTTPTADAIDAFLARWSKASGMELANAQLFLSELVDLLDLPRPDPASEDTRDNAYVFERRVQFAHGDGSASLGRIDLYRRGAFVCEAKKVRADADTRGFTLALLKARSQAEAYARALPAEEGRPPFLIVVDVGHTIDLYAEFSRSGATYTPFPDPSSHRIRLPDLRRPEIIERLRQIWLDPLALDPSRVSARVTRAIAADLAELARSLESKRIDAERVGGFLTRCLFTLFAEDVDLLPAGSFTGLLADCEREPAQLVPLLTELWRVMDAGGFSVALRKDLLRFNGKLFKQPEVLALDREQIGLLSRAARHDWTHVEPAIFGTLLERALDPTERHALGAHYTPRAYVERLVIPTVIEPLRADWTTAQAAALTLEDEGDHKGALALIRAFHHQLCNVRVLDPACGSGNFLYVTLEHLKRLEGEVLNRLSELGDTQGLLDLAGTSVDPHQFLGIELNPRAAAIAEMVLWIGHLQWHFRTRGHVAPPQPVLKDFHNIECRDAVLAHDGEELLTGPDGQPLTRWDGRTTKPHPVTGEPVPDDSARVPLYRYKNPRKAEWPAADFVVGNPPFIGNKRMRGALGDGYVEALRAAWTEVPDTADLVMYWWDHAAELTRAGKLRAFGLITTNSLRQTFNRQITERHLRAADPIHLAFVVPDHPWVDSADGAAVRVAMSSARPGSGVGRLLQVIEETPSTDGEIEVSLREKSGLIHADLTAGANVAGACKLQANTGLCFQGMNLVGKGFRLEPEDVTRLGYDLERLPDVIKPHCNARDLMQGGEHCYVIDFYGYSAEQARAEHPALYQWLFDRVKPEREQNNRKSYRENWWVFGEARGKLRRSWAALRRVLLTPETAKHRMFAWMDLPFGPDHKLYVLCVDEPMVPATLGSHVHRAWALAAGGTLEDRPTWTNTTCFLTFPFPAFDTPESEALKARIADLAEQLDAHRKRQQAAHPSLTLTGMYNVLEKLRAGEALDGKERTIHDQGLVSVLKQLHDEIDVLVLAAYGWSDLAPQMQIVNGNAAPPAGQTRDDTRRALDEALLERLVALNTERAAEEARGHIRWLRPDYQNPAAHPQAEITIDTEEPETATPAPTAPATRLPWPKDITDQIRAVAQVLASSPAPLTEDAIATHFTARGRWRDRLPRILETLVALGHAQHQNGHYRRT
jgi:hypothetical protein